MKTCNQLYQPMSLALKPLRKIFFGANLMETTLHLAHLALQVDTILPTNFTIDPKAMDNAIPIMDMATLDTTRVKSQSLIMDTALPDIVPLTLTLVITDHQILK